MDKGLAMNKESTREMSSCRWTSLCLLCLMICKCAAGGCIFLRDDQSVRCQNTSLGDIGESLHILTVVVQNTPQTIDIEGCDSGSLGRLPPVFSGISNATIERVRVRRSGVRSLHPDVFIPLAGTVTDLDLSHNALRTVPDAVAILRYLERLNLQHNRIVFLRPSATFDGLTNLRELNLAHNYVGQAKDLTDDLTEQHGYELKGSLKLDDFSLGRAVRSIESLSLRGNRLASVPKQLSSHTLTQLKRLDLSENVISKVEELSTALLPKLEYLDFQSNRVQSIAFYSLPITLEYLDLRENPFNCDCQAYWLYDWYSTNSTEIRMPSCTSPEEYRDLPLDEVPWARHCNATFAFRYMPKASEGLRDYEVIQLVSSATSVTVSWKVQDSALRTKNRKWAVVYRRASDSPYQMTLVPAQEHSAQESVLMQRISKLRPATSYVVCVAIVKEGKYTVEPSKCRKVVTKRHQDVGEESESEFSWDKIHTGLDELSVSATSITVRWQLKTSEPLPDMDDSVSVRHEWTIRIRRTGSDNYTEIPVYDITSIGETNGQMYEYAIPDLASRTHYDVCLIDVEHRPIGDRLTAIPMDGSSGLRVEPVASCATVQTSSNYMLYATEIAAIALACAICFIVSAVTIFLCRQKKLLRWKPKKLKKWFAQSCKERPAPVGCSKLAAATIPRVHCEPRTAEKYIVGSWNTLRMPYSEFSQRPDFHSFRTTGYKDALTCVTIYKSGYSEC